MGFLNVYLFEHIFQTHFSANGIRIAWEYFTKLGFEEVTIFCSMRQMSKTDRDLLDRFENAGILKWVQNQTIGGEKRTYYDDL